MKKRNEIHTDNSNDPSNNIGSSRDPYYTHKKR